MSEKEYMRLINRNILRGWSIIGGILLLSYVIEVVKGLRSVPYVIIFSIILLGPIIYSLAKFKASNGSVSLKMEFIFGYGLLYTFVMFSAETPVTFVYILPMVSLLIVYCDKIALAGLYIYAVAINLISIVLQCSGKLELFDVIKTFKGQMTYWEIQIACIILTGLFVVQSCDLLIKRNNIIFELRDDAFNDSLTGLKNKRFLEEYKGDLFKFTHLKTSSVSVAFIDIDDFKQFNTNYGHTFGDEVLKSVAVTMMALTTDLPNTYALRNGGDEFLIISASMLPGEFIKLSKNLCDKIRSMTLDYQGKDVGVTISIGVATKNDYYKCPDFDALYELADARNEQAKNEGKNRVIYDE